MRGKDHPQIRGSGRPSVSLPLRGSALSGAPRSQGLYLLRGSALSGARWGEHWENASQGLCPLRGSPSQGLCALRGSACSRTPGRARCVLAVPGLCPGCALAVSRVCSGCILGVSWASSGRVLAVSGTFLGCSGCVLGVSWAQPGCRLGVSWTPSGLILGIGLSSPGQFVGKFFSSSGLILGVSTQSFGSFCESLTCPCQVIPKLSWSFLVFRSKRTQVESLDASLDARGRRSLSPASADFAAATEQKRFNFLLSATFDHDLSAAALDNFDLPA